MIAKLKGLLDAVGADQIVIDVNGVGYLVHCSARTLRQLPQIGEGLSLDIETRVREDAIQLFGFASSAEREWFRLLQDVQGVGAKLALAILSTFDAAELSGAIARNDKAMIARAPGVGPKLAARLAMELKDKVPAFADIAAGLPVVALSGAVSEAASALINLGYKAADAERAVQAALAKADEGAAVGQIIRLALRELAR